MESSALSFSGADIETIMTRSPNLPQPTPKQPQTLETRWPKTETEMSLVVDFRVRGDSFIDRRADDVTHWLLPPHYRSSRP